MFRSANGLHQPRLDGFSAIELAFVVAATSIVLALGVAMYRTYLVRAQVETSVEEAAATQRLVAAAFKGNGVPPFDAAAAGIDATVHRLLKGTYIESIDIHNGRIDLRFGSNADSAIAGKTLSLTPFEAADRSVVWICGNERPGVGLEPLGFAGGGAQAELSPTAIDDRFLPRRCR